MADIQDGGGRRGGRARNVELNLVPVIDLMSVLITFLLLSAVWTQVSMIQLGASFVSKRDEDDQEIKPPPMEDLVLKLDIKKTGYTLYVGKDTSNIPSASDGSFDNQTLFAQMQKVKQLYPDKGDVKMAIADDVVYDYVIAAMDTSLKAGFAPALLTGGPK